MKHTEIKGLLIAALITALVAANPARADEKVRRIAAALSIAQHALVTEDASHLAAAAEMLGALEPTGDPVKTGYIAEARFLARGDPDLLARLKVAAGVTVPDPSRVVAGNEAGRISVPERQALRHLALVPDQAGEVTDETGQQVCSRAAAAPIWACDPALATGVLHLPPSRYVVFQTVPDQRE